MASALIARGRVSAVMTQFFCFVSSAFGLPAAGNTIFALDKDVIVLMSLHHP